jgi:drug/metabolite transporter (DMT)-like permease
MEADGAPGDALWSPSHLLCSRAPILPPVLRTAVEAIIALLLFGGIPVIVKSVAANPFTIGVFRLTVATIGVVAIMAWRRQLHRVPRADLARLAVIGAFFFIHWITLFFGIKISSASIGAIGLSTYGIHLLILGAIFARERPGPIVIFSVLLAAAGAMLVVPELNLSNAVALGMLLTTFSAAMYASLPLLHQRWSHIPNHTRTLGQFAFALLFFLLFVGKTDWNLAPSDWAGLLFLGLGVTLIGHSLWVRVTTKLSPSVTSIVYYGNIPIAIALSVIVRGEPLTPRTLAGAALIIAGSVIGLAMRRPAAVSATESGDLG